MIQEHVYDDAAELTADLVAAIVGALSAALARGQASLVVSGGKTPAAAFRLLSAAPLQWQKVTVTLADERWVDPDSPDSNEHLVRTTLLQGDAAAARFVPLKQPGADAAAGIDAVAHALAAVPRPFDVVMLGMGDDGHTASLFPGATALARALAPDAPDCLAVRPPAAAHERVSLSKRALLDARRIIILIEGDAKWQAYQRARAPGDESQFPVRAFLHQDKVPVDVYWSR